MFVKYYLLSCNGSTVDLAKLKIYGMKCKSALPAMKLIRS